MKTLFQYTLMMVMLVVIFSVTPFILPLDKALSQQDIQYTDQGYDQEYQDDQQYRPRRHHRGHRNDGRRPRKGGPLMRVLDTDKNGVLSLEETENAIAALKSLDSDGDGNITRYELHQQNDRQDDQGRNTNYERREPQRDNEYNRY
jgi:hypothetical protein